METIKEKQQNDHFDLVSLYSESLSELSNYKGLNSLYSGLVFSKFEDL